MVNYIIYPSPNKEVGQKGKGEIQWFFSLLKIFLILSSYSEKDA